MRSRRGLRPWVCGWVVLAALSAQAGELRRVAYEHPGLVVDLGVGLWAWPVPADADGDGDLDLVVSCPDKPSNGVWLFENASGDTAADPFPVFRAGRRLSGTVHYVTSSDVDGQVRVLAPGVEFPGFARVGTRDARPFQAVADWYVPRWNEPRGPKVRHRQWRFADVDGDGSLDLVAGIEDWSEYGWDDGYDASGRWTKGPLHGFVFVRRGRSDGGYDPPEPVVAAGRPVDVFGCPSPNFADFDGDGDLDLLCGSFLDSCTYFANTGSRNAPVHAAGRSPVTVTGRRLTMELQMIVPVACDWNRDGWTDLVVGEEDGRVALVLHAGRVDEHGTPVFHEPVHFRQEADTLKCGALATPCGVDWDGDGDEDIVSGNTAGFIEWFENLSGPGVGRPRWAAPRRLEAGGETFRLMAGASGSIQGPAEAKWGYTTLSVADWDHDGLHDVVLNGILGDVTWLRNVGGPRAPRLDRPRPVEVAWEDPQPRLAWGWRTPAGAGLLTQWRTTPVAQDLDADGLVDLTMLDHEGFLAFFRRERVADGLVLRPPQRRFLDEAGQPLRLATGRAGASGRRKLCVVDWDGDGHFDLLVNSRNATLLRQVGADATGWRFRDEGPLADGSIEGHDVSPAVVDWNADGHPDFLGGAEDGRLYLLERPPSGEE